MLRTILITMAFAGALAAPAAASSIVYTDNGNVMVATPDGAVNRAFTTDGTTTKPPYEDPNAMGRLVGPYASASADDRGRVLASRTYRFTDGTDELQTWAWFGPDGRSLGTNPVDMPTTCGTWTRPIGPGAARLDAAGEHVVFSYFCAGDTYVALNRPNERTPVWNDPVRWHTYLQPAWFGKRLSTANGRVGFVQKDGGTAPFETDMLAAVAMDGGEGSVTTLEYARDGSRAVITARRAAETQARLFLLRVSGPIPSDDGIADQCSISTAGAPVGQPSLSPDGRFLAFTDSEGVKVTELPARDAEGDPCAVQPRLLSATGQNPVFTAWTFDDGKPKPPADAGAPAPAPVPPTPIPAGGPSPTPRATPAALFTVARKATVATLRGGLRLSLVAPAAGRFVVAVKRGPAKVATKKARATKAGALSVKVRVPGAAKLRGRTLTVAVAFTPAAGGATATLTRKVRVR